MPKDSDQELPMGYAHTNSHFVLHGLVIQLIFFFMEKNRSIAAPKLLLKKDSIQVVCDTVKVSTIYNK